MPKIALILIGCLIGYLFTGWAVWMLIHRMRVPKARRKQLRVPLWVLILFLLIGTGDAYKSTKDLIEYLKAPTGSRPGQSVK